MQNKNKIIILIISFLISYNMFSTWANIPHSQNNPETIEQAIARIVASHNNSAIAHNEPGQSLDLHRKDTIIDHPAGSVKNDKGSRSIFDYQNYFSDFTDWIVNNNYVKNADNSVLYQNSMTTSNHILRKEFSPFFVKMADNFSKSFSTEFSLNVFSTFSTSQKIRLGVGYEIPDPAFFGFEIEGHNVYAVALSQNNTQYKNLISNFDPFDGVLHSVLVQYDATEKKMYWYIDDQLVHSADTLTNNIITNIDPYITYNVKLTNFPISQTEFYFFNPKFSVDYTY